MECKVVFSDTSLKKSFEELSITDPRLAKEIEKALNEICKNHSVGRNVQKRLIPRDLVRKYNIDNLWIYNLRKDWRLIYSIGGDKIEILAIVLDWMNHKEYERLFKFT
jgi:Txe/YoeB family toxin of Txe-Axe toxin-antitoxin module